MAQQARTLSDTELMSVFNDSRADLSLLTGDEHRRLLRLTEPAPEATPPQAPLWRQAMPAVAGVVDAMRGARAGLTSTGVEIADVGRRLVGGPRLSENPAIRAQMTPPESLAGQIGYGGERLAEFMVPALKVHKAMRAAPLFSRTMAEAGTAAGVIGAQTGGDPESMIGAAGLGAAGPTVFGVAGAGVRAARQAAAGAREGGVGGALAGAIRTTAPLPAKAMLFSAIKPRATLVNWDRSMNLALPELKATEQVLGRPIGSVDDLIEATSVAKRQVYQQLTQVRGTAQGFEADLSPVADAMVRSIPRKLQLENPDAALRLQQTAGVYRQRFSLDDAEQLLKETNAEMEAFYSKYPVAQRRALTADPEWARLDAQAKALRTSIDATLDRAAEGGGAAARELRHRYGALLDVETESFRRANVAKRQQPESLSEQLSQARAAMEIARGTWRVARGLASGDLSGFADIAGGVAMRDTAKFLKEQQTADALIRRAFAGYTGQPTPVVMPARRPVRGYLERGPITGPPVSDPSFVRGVPAVPVQSIRRALPPPAARPMPAHDVSGVQGVSARPIVVRDPRTGRMRRIYLGEGR